MLSMFRLAIRFVSTRYWKKIYMILR